jgi:hypothetical protein
VKVPEGAVPRDALGGDVLLSGMAALTFEARAALASPCRTSILAAQC